MSSPLHFQRYQEFKRALEQLRMTIAATQLQEAALRESFQNVQHIFERQIASLSADDIAPEHAARWQSIQTEIYKQMRLLATDIMLLQASRSPATSQRRVLGVRTRLDTLIQYCEALLQL
jgi:hypothetical protein